MVIPLSVPELSSSPIHALVDSGSSDSFADSSFIRSCHVVTKELALPRSLRLFDGGLAPSGPITHSIALSITPVDGASHIHTFLLTSIVSSVPLVLGIDWLTRINPSIDWKELRLRFNQIK